MKLVRALDRFYYDMTLTELRLMNENELYPDISYNSLLYLDLISYQPGCTVSGLAKALYVTKAAATMRVNELIRRGLVVKTVDEEDRRVNHLALTPTMQQDQARYKHRLQRAVATLEARYTPQQMEDFCAMLEDLSSAYMDPGQNGDLSKNGKDYSIFTNNLHTAPAKATAGCVAKSCNATSIAALSRLARRRFCSTLTV